MDSIKGKVLLDNVLDNANVIPDGLRVVSGAPVGPVELERSVFVHAGVGEGRGGVARQSSAVVAPSPWGVAPLGHPWLVSTPFDFLFDAAIGVSDGWFQWVGELG